MRQLEGAGDGTAAVELAVMRLGPHSDLHVVEDPLRVLGARIVRREDRDVREAHGHRPHGGPLAAVAIAARAEHDDEPLLGEGTQRLERPLERVGRVSVITQHDARPLGDPLHPTGDLRRTRQPLGDGLDRDAQPPGARRHAEGVGHVEAAEQREPYLRTAHGGDELEAGA